MYERRTGVQKDGVGRDGGVPCWKASCFGLFPLLRRKAKIPRKQRQRCKREQGRGRAGRDRVPDPVHSIENDSGILVVPGFRIY